MARTFSGIEGSNRCGWGAASGLANLGGGSNWLTRRSGGRGGTGGALGPTG